MKSLLRTALVCISTLISSVLSFAQQATPFITQPNLVRMPTSAPLRHMPPLRPRDEHLAIPLRSVPHSPTPLQADPVIQSSAIASATTFTGLNFDGIGKGFGDYVVGVAPPDTNGAAGDTQFVQWVNTSFAIFDKASGTLLYGPAAGNTLWQGSSLTACADNNDGDPVVLFDRMAHRWIFSQISFTNGPPFYVCFAVSQTSDATGPYNRYALEWTGDTLPDYPKVGTWPDAFYASVNLFFGGFLFVGGQICALERDKMLADLDAGVQCFTLSSNASLLPSDVDGAAPPPTGAPNYFLSLGSNALSLFRFHVDWANPNSTTLSGPISIPVAAFNRACNGGACIPQPGTSQQLDTIGDRLMFRLAYRNFGSYESLVVTHSVNPGNKKVRAGQAVSAIRWYELRNPGGTPAVVQQGTYSPTADARWMGSAAMDKVGNIAVGYSVSSSAVHPSIRFAVHTPADPAGVLEAETSIVEGTGSQLPNLNRWGDYSSMSVDPVDDCTFWYTTEYLKADGTFNWSTRIAAFKLDSCQ